MREPLRILSVADGLPDPNSGAAGSIYFTNRALRSLGHQVEELWMGRVGPRRIRHGNLHSLLEQPTRYVAAIRKAVKLADYDVILAQQPQAWESAKDHRLSGRPGIFLTASQGVETRISRVLDEWRVRLQEQVPWSPRRLLAPLLRNRLERQWPEAARWSDGVVVQHTEDKNFVCSEYGLASDSVHVWASGLSPIFCASPAPRMTPTRMLKILCVGQMAFYKGPHVLGQTVSQVLREFPDMQMTWVCAESDHANAIEHFAQDIRSRVFMAPWCAQERLVEILDEHGIFVFPTLAEGFAKAPLEAMARGLCVVASNCCGMRDYIETNRNGVLVDVGDASGFTRSIERLLHDGSFAEQLATLAVQTSRSYTWEESAKALVGFCRARLLQRSERIQAHENE